MSQLSTNNREHVVVPVALQRRSDAVQAPAHREEGRSHRARADAPDKDDDATTVHTVNPAPRHRQRKRRASLALARGFATASRRASFTSSAPVVEATAHGNIIVRWLAKWKLAVRSLAYASIALAVRIVLENRLGTDAVSIVDISATSVFFTASIFVISLMLQGVVQDYKESERAPGQIATILEGIEETFTVLLTVRAPAMTAASQPGLSTSAVHIQAVRRRLWELVESILGWLSGAEVFEDVSRAISALPPLIEPLERLTVLPHDARILNEITTLRHVITRIRVIKETEFLAPGYAILQIFGFVVVLTVIVGEFPSTSTAYAVVLFVAFTYVYLLLLIKDIDDPFEFEEQPRFTLLGGAVEVDMEPLLFYRRMLAARMDSHRRSSVAMPDDAQPPPAHVPAAATGLARPPSLRANGSGSSNSTSGTSTHADPASSGSVQTASHRGVSLGDVKAAGAAAGTTGGDASMHSVTSWSSRKPASIAPAPLGSVSTSTSVAASPLRGGLPVPSFARAAPPSARLLAVSRNTESIVSASSIPVAGVASSSTMDLVDV